MNVVSLVNVSMNMAEISEKSYFYADFTQLSPVYYSFIVLYLGVMTLAFLGNFLVCVTVFSDRSMHTVVNYYIVNLALCDLMVGIFVLPMKLLELAAPASWGILNNNLCTAMSYLQTVFVFASVLTLVASCLERYFAIVYPLESRIEQSKCRTIKILLAVWAVPCVVALPFLDSADARTTTLQSQFGTISRLTCFVAFSATFRRGYYTFLFITMYILPLSLIGCTCVRISCCLLKSLPLYRQGSVRRQEANRRKIAKMVVVVVIAFFLSWTPYFLISIITQYQRVNFFQRENFFFTMLCINLFAFLNSCVNPFIYASMSTRFRKSFKRFFKCLLCYNYKSYTDDPVLLNSRPLTPSSLSRQLTVVGTDATQNALEYLSQTDKVPPRIYCLLRSKPFNRRH
ncbi:cholecystokinin receptor-like [Limulus polyphemus]|uniref:Cholecystokinin receptor-like n=1 Tax=Limulus polyphemus TaxID=6850 RepID=A0ABM1SZ10_LIMPO|nr:cholecystokinin receptor-like [Limulus polyphemus]